MKQPSWVTQLVVGLILSGLVAWATWVTAATWGHEARVTVVESKMDDITEVKNGVRDVNLKVDRLVEALLKRKEK